METKQGICDSEVSDDSFDGNNSFEDSSDEYRVEFWEEGEEEPTGYKIKGKYIFGKSVEMMKIRLKKSKLAKKVKDQKYFVTDVRNIKHGTEIDVEIDDEEKGGACVKFFGPNKKNEYTIVVNKMKKYPQKFVKFVTKKVIIPMVDSYIMSIQNEGSKKSTNSTMEFCCTDCGKRFVSDRNLKTHKMKMHEKVETEGVQKRKQLSVLNGKHSSVSNKKTKKSANSNSSSNPQEIPMDLDIVIGGPNSNVQGQEGENLQIDIVKLFKEISDLKKSQMENHTVIKNLKTKVDLLEAEINTLKSDLEEESSQNCEQCSFQTNEKWRLIKHVHILHKNGCDKCVKKFTSREDLEGHRKSNHSKQQKYCPDYLYEKCMFSKEECQYLHSEKEKSPLNFKCTDCENLFTTEEDLTEHMTLHQQWEDIVEMQVDQLQCSQCQNMFGSFEVFKEHQALHQQTQQNTCTDCDESFSDIKILNEHKDTHHQFKCSKCSEHFDNENDLKIHFKSHLQYIPCKNVSSCKYGENCYYNHEPRKENEYPCYECGNTYQDIKTLMGHRKSQHGRPVCKKFLDNSCNFSEQGCWFSHKLTHQMQPVFQKDTVKLKPPLENNNFQNQILLKSMLETMEQIKNFMMKKQ